MTQVNGMEITDKLVDFLRTQKTNNSHAENKLSEVMDLIIELQMGGIPDDESGMLFKMLLFDVKGLRDDMRQMRIILESCKTESL